MPDLMDSLLKQDIGHLRIVAEFWGLDLDTADLDAAREELSASLLEPGLFAELIESLSPEAVSAITTLANSGGRLPWPTFIRKYGEIRVAGAGKRDREMLHRNPASTTEILYYRGLIARAFFDTEKGPQEFAYIPDDVFSLLNEKGQKVAKKPPALRDASSEPRHEPLGRPASPGERGQESLADDTILDDATTMLAALRLEIESPETKTPKAVLQAILQTAKLINEKGIPQPEPVKNFLESSRKDALNMLRDAWLKSVTFNELKLMPGIICEGEWTNQPLETRQFLLNLFNDIPEGKWWSLYAFIRDVKQKHPDFQRPAGDYDSWFIKNPADGDYLRGFASWNQVDGALVKYFITAILQYLGRVDLSVAEEVAEPTAFRISTFEGRKDENGKVAVSSNGRISIPYDAPRVVRYKVSRFCKWDEAKPDEYRYRLTPHSLAKAKEQGLKIEHLLPLLAKHSAGVPPTLVKALKRWEINGTEARAETQVVLRVSRPEVLEEMRKSRAGKFLGEVLSPTAVIVHSGAIQKVMEVLTELGFLAEDLTREK